MVSNFLLRSHELPAYGTWVRDHLQGSLWQSVEWKTYQEALGREVRIYAEKKHDAIVASALVVIDRTKGNLSTWDIPRGPLWGMESREWRMENAKLLEQIMEEAKNDRCISLYVSPQKKLSTFNCQLSTSHRHLYPEATRVIDLMQSEDDILAQMKPKGRYNIKVAQKHGVTVRLSRDTDAFYDLLTKTAARDGFTGQPQSHYRAFLEKIPGAFLVLACDTTKKPIAGLMGVIWNEQGIYYYGASDSAFRRLMAPYLLQWEAMRYCKTQGCRSYDLLGVAPDGAGPDHPWKGITMFKEKFGGAYIAYPPEQEIVLRPWVKRALEMKRRLLG